MPNNKRMKVDPRIIRTKRMFKEALISLIKENSDINKLTVQMIADRAELNRATFYLHFRDIDDLKEQMIDEVLAELNKIMMSPTEVNKDKKGKSRLISFLEHFYQNAGLYNVMLENKDFRKRVFDILLDILTFWETNRKEKGRSFQLPKEIIASSTFGIISWWLEEGTPYSPEYLANLIDQRFNN
ncbi:TetR/AcrR family transcriptional regulator [Cytobacillus sp. Hz8]|uniref:TetR/AcrR family transcriptional regulator n=1 Tax=Cytobacillus sp. Hz8 TaxID=3347168 RepID=UPI0035DE8B3C